MADNQDNNLSSNSRRRVLSGLGTLVAAGILPRRISAQGAVTETDVLIIGGGIAGSSTAFHLAEQGSEVVLLERGEIASEASGQNMGGLGGNGWGNNPDLLSYLTAGGEEQPAARHRSVVASSARTRCGCSGGSLMTR